MKALSILPFLCSFIFAEVCEFRTFYSADYNSRTEARFIQYCSDSIFVKLQKRDLSFLETKLTDFSIEDRIYVTKRHNQWLVEKKRPQRIFPEDSKRSLMPKKRFVIVNKDPLEEGYLGALFKDHWRNPSKKFSKDHWVIINHLNLKRSNYNSPIELRPDPITGQRVIIDYKSKKRLCPPSGCR